tara:strand:- start:74 stop:352 length:279 start_codon:yes stop_codon:yes gene_type:complete
MMTQYDDVVENQRLLIEAEEWAKGIKSIHAHSMSSMWYDDRPQDTEGGKSVMDTQYNNGVIRRDILSTDEVYMFGKALTGQELVDEYRKHNH